MLKLMNPEHRKQLGKSGLTSSEAQRRYARQAERKMHDTFIQWLGNHKDRLYWDRSRMDKETTNRKGHPDFVVIAATRVCLIEFKVPGNTLSADQKEVHAWLERTGTHPLICFNVESAIEAVRKLLADTEIEPRAEV